MWSLAFHRRHSRRMEGGALSDVGINQIASRRGDHENIFRALDLATSRSATLRISEKRATTKQGIDTVEYFFLRCDRNLRSLSRCGGIRATTRTPWWRDREEQQPKSFAWSPMLRPAPRLRPSDRSLIRASSTWCACWLGRPRGTSCKPNQTAGSVTVSRNKEAS